MRLSSHLDKGFWISADKFLMAAHGIVTNLIIVRSLPTQELALYIILYQTIFLVMNTFLVAFVFQPLMKFGAERPVGEGVAQSSLNALGIGVLVFFTVAYLVAQFGDRWYGVEGLQDHPFAVPLLLATFIPRLYLQHLFQSHYKVREVFWCNFSFAAISAIALSFLAYENRLQSTSQVLAWLCGASLAGSLLSIGLARPFWSSFRTGDAGVRRRMLQFGTLNLGSTGSFVLFGYLDNHLIALFCTPLEISIYYSAKLLTRIFDVFSQIVQTTLIPTVSRLHSLRDWITLRTVFEKAVCFSTLILLPVFGLLVWFPEEIVYLLFGGRFPQSAPLLRMFALLAITAPWNSVISSYYVAMNRLKTALVVNLITIVLMIAGYIVWIPSLKAYGATLAVVTVVILSTILNIAITRRILQFRFIEVLKRVVDAVNFVRHPRRGVGA